MLHPKWDPWKIYVILWWTEKVTIFCIFSLTLRDNTYHKLPVLAEHARSAIARGESAPYSSDLLPSSLRRPDLDGRGEYSGQMILSPSLNRIKNTCENITFPRTVVSKISIYTGIQVQTFQMQRNEPPKYPWSQICLYLPVSLFTFICEFVYIYLWVCLYLPVSLFIFICQFVYICLEFTYIYLWVCSYYLWVCLYLSVSLFIFTCEFVYICLEFTYIYLWVCLYLPVSLFISTCEFVYIYLWVCLYLPVSLSGNSGSHDPRRRAAASSRVRWRQPRRSRWRQHSVLDDTASLSSLPTSSATRKPKTCNRAEGLFDVRQLCVHSHWVIPPSEGRYF